MKFTTILFFLFVVFGITRGQDCQTKEYYSSGNLSGEGPCVNGKKDGEWSFYMDVWSKDKFKDITSKGVFKNGKKNGKWTNYYDMYYESSGRLPSESGNYVDDVKHGEWKTYYAFKNRTVSLKSIGSYVNGKKHGTWYNYNDLGNKNEHVTSSHEYENGVLHGSSFDYKNGISVSEYVYENGVLKLTKHDLDDIFRVIDSNNYLTDYYKYGDEVLFDKISRKGQLDENLKQTGIWREYYRSGQLKSEETYLEDKCIGDWVNYHENGNISVEGTCKNGEVEGEYREYYENRNLKALANFKMSQLNGVIRQFYPDQSIKVIGEFKNGKEVGLWKQYYPNGNLEILFTARINESGESILVGDKYEFYEDGSVLLHAIFDKNGETKKSKIYSKPGKKFIKIED